MLIQLSIKYTLDIILRVLINNINKLYSNFVMVTHRAVQEDSLGPVSVGGDEEAVLRRRYHQLHPRLVPELRS